jgi:hypothetical protein
MVEYGRQPPKDYLMFPLAGILRIAICFSPQAFDIDHRGSLLFHLQMEVPIPSECAAIKYLCIACFAPRIKA